MAYANGIEAAMKNSQTRCDPLPRVEWRRDRGAPGYPSVIVPFALLPNEPTPPFPAGFDAKPGPYGVSFSGAACSEPRLMRLAYAFEQATKRRVPPASAP